MNYEAVFSSVGVLAMLGWVLLLVSPLMPKWSDRIAGVAIPAFLAFVYTVWIILFPAERGGFGSFEAVAHLFSEPNAVMAGWIHFLAFDLFVGAWICRTARADKLSFWMVLPCLPVTFMFGPAGYMLFIAIRAGHSAFGARSLAPMKSI